MKRHLYPVQATIVRNAKDTAHTKAERNILEGVKVTVTLCLTVKHAAIAVPD